MMQIRGRDGLVAGETGVQNINRKYFPSQCESSISQLSFSIKKVSLGRREKEGRREGRKEGRKKGEKEGRR